MAKRKEIIYIFECEIEGQEGLKTKEEVIAYLNSTPEELDNRKAG